MASLWALRADKYLLVKRVGNLLSQYSSRRNEYRAALVAVAIGSFGLACSLESGARAAAMIDVEVEEENEKKNGRIMTVDFNNFLPCFTVEKSSDGKSKMIYQPAF